jgi:hypothetical protein
VCLLFDMIVRTLYYIYIKCIEFSVEWRFFKEIFEDHIGHLCHHQQLEFYVFQRQKNCEHFCEMNMETKLISV